MTGDHSKFAAMRPKDGAKVTFGGEQSRKIAGIGEVSEKDELQIKDVYYIEGLCHNLLSVNQSVDRNN